MRKLIIILLLVVSNLSFGQNLLNGSFENGSGADISSWEWTCDAQPSNTAPVGGGNWCIKVEGGNSQGCFPGYAFQKLPTITNGQTFILSGWAIAELSNAQTTSLVGIYFGKISNGNLTTQAF